MPGFTEAAYAIYAGTATAAAYVTVASYVYTAYSLIEAQKQQKEARDAANAATTDRLVTVRSSSAATRIIYGRTRAAADTIAHVCQHGPRREFVTFVLPLAHHEVESIDDIWFNDQSIGTLDVDGYVEGGPYYRVSESWQTDVLTGGTIGATGTLSHIPTSIMSVASQVATTLDEGATQYEILHEGTDYSLSGDTITWLVDHTSMTYAFSYRWNTGARLVRVKKFLGIGAGERDTDLETNSGGEWTSAHIGRFVARLHVTLQYDNDIFGPVGVPNITAIVKGKKVYNWTTGATAWSNNAALCAADYLTSSDGFAIATGRINTTMMQTAQALCDEWVPSWAFSVNTTTDEVTINGPPHYVGEAVRFYNTGGALPSPLSASTTYYITAVVSTSPGGGVYTVSTSAGGATVNLTTTGTGTNLVQQRRYTVDGQISSEANLRDNLKLLMGAMSGKAIYSGGEWRLKGGAFISPVATLDESDLADGAISILPNPRRSDLYNGVRGTFPDPQNLYQTSSFAPYLSSTYSTIDGASIVSDISLPLTQDGMRAQRIAKRMLFEHRSSLSIAANWKLSTFGLQTGDTVYLKLSRYGWDADNGGLGKYFIVGERKMSPTGTIQMALIETSSAIDAWDYSEASNPDPAPNTTLPSPRYVAQLSGVTFDTSATTYTVLSDGAVIPYAQLEWTAVTASSVLQGGRIEVLWKRAPEIAWQTIKLAPDEISTRIFPVSAGETINVQINVYNGAGAKSAPMFATFICSSLLPVSKYVSLAYGNLISGADFTSATQWTLGVQSGASDAFLLRSPDPDAKMAGSPSNIILYQSGVESKYSLGRSNSFPAIAGQRYVFYGSVLGHRASGRIDIEWLDANGGVLPGVQGNTIASNTATSPKQIGDYSTSGGFATAPATAVSGRINLIKLATSEGANSGAYFAQPFVAPVDSALDVYPSWTAGVSPSVSTEQIDGAAATDIWTAEFAVSGEAAWYGSTRRVCVLQFTPSVTGPAEITGSVTVTQQTAATLAYWKFSNTAATPMQLKSVGGKLAVDVSVDAADPTFWLAAPASGNIPVPAQMTQGGTRTVGLVAGTTYTLGISVVNDGDFVIDSGSPNTIDYAMLRVVQIKR